MAVNSAEDNGIVRCGAGKRFVRWESLLRPEILVPTPPLNPFARFHRARALSYATYDFVVAGRAGEEDVAERRGKAQQMGMSVDHPGDHCAASEIHDARTRPREHAGLRIRPDKNNSSVAHPEGGSHRPCVVYRIDARVYDDEVWTLDICARRSGRALCTRSLAGESESSNCGDGEDSFGAHEAKRLFDGHAGFCFVRGIGARADGE